MEDCIAMCQNASYLDHKRNTRTTDAGYSKLDNKRNTLTLQVLLQTFFTISSHS